MAAGRLRAARSISEETAPTRLFKAILPNAPGAGLHRAMNDKWVNHSLLVRSDLPFWTKFARHGRIIVAQLKRRRLPPEPILMATKNGGDAYARASANLRARRCLRPFPSAVRTNPKSADFLGSSWPSASPAGPSSCGSGRPRQNPVQATTSPAENPNKPEHRIHSAAKSEGLGAAAPPSRASVCGDRSDRAWRKVIKPGS
jgi:hypothetical protein